MSGNLQTASPTMVKTHYEVLGISPTASSHELRAAFKRLALELHPDKGGCKEAFQKTLEAFEVLADKQGRAEYDLSIKAQQASLQNSKKRMRAHPRPSKASSNVGKRAKTCCTTDETGNEETRKQRMQKGGRQPPSSEATELALPQARRGIGRCAVAAKQRENKVLSKVFLLLQRLPEQPRRRLVQEQLTQPQRLALEAWALSSFAMRSPPSPKPTHRSVSAVPKMLCEEQVEQEEKEEMPTREVEAENCKVPGSVGVRGLASKVRSQKTLYQANVCFETFYMTAREVQDLGAALDALVVLTEVKQRVMSGSSATSFEDSVKAALRAVLAEHGLTSKDLGLRFQVMMSMRYWVQPSLHTPQKQDIDEALSARRRLVGFRARFGEGARGLSKIDLNELKDRWLAFRQAYLDILEESGRDRASSAARLDELEEAAQPCRDRRLERWNRLAMQAEDRPRHTSKKAALAFESSKRRAERAARAAARAARARAPRPPCLGAQATKAKAEERRVRRLKRLLVHWERAHRVTLRLETAQMKALKKEMARQRRKQAMAARYMWRCQNRKEERSAAKQKRLEQAMRWKQMNRKDITMEELLYSRPTGRSSESETKVPSSRRFHSQPTNEDSFCRVG